MTNQPFLCQWLARINRTADKCSVSPKGGVFSIERPSPAELNRHELMLVTFLIHETQHIATYVFLDSDPDNTDSVPVKTIEPEANGGSGIKSPAPSPGGPQKRTTPPHIGSCTFEGRDIGDSGFALEEIIFGGRLGHVEPGSTPFEVHALNSARAVSVSDINMLLPSQMSGLTADVQVEDRPAKSRRVRLSDEYVSKLLDGLKHGRCAALLISHRAFRLIRFLAEGNWRDLHLDNAATGDAALYEGEAVDDSEECPNSVRGRLFRSAHRENSIPTWPRGRPTIFPARHPSRSSRNPEMKI